MDDLDDGTCMKIKQIKQLWQQHNKPIKLYTFTVIKQKLYYIHNNPVKVGFVPNAIDRNYSSAINYAGGKGLLEIKLLNE
jgi:hypothetical protein